MDLFSLLQEELERYRNSVTLIKQYIRVYELRITELIVNISHKDFENCQSDFDELFNIQQNFSMMQYKYDYKAEKKITDFIYHLDRDDIYSREFWYAKFKNGQKWPEE